MFGSYHVHTFWSDGKNSVKEYLTKAKKIGLKELGISDHLDISEGQYYSSSMPLNKLDYYIAELESLKSVAKEMGVTLLLGLEVDYRKNSAAKLRDFFKNKPFDYLIGSIHYIDDLHIAVDSSIEIWENLNESERNDVIRKYWIAVKEMAECNVFSFAGHLDLNKKFGFYATCDISKEIDTALDAIAKVKMGIELNTAGWYYPCKEEYPSPAILKQALLKDIPVVLNADAHNTDNLIRDFERGRTLLYDIGYRKLASFHKRKIRYTEL